MNVIEEGEQYVPKEATLVKYRLIRLIKRHKSEERVD